MASPATAELDDALDGTPVPPQRRGLPPGPRMSPAAQTLAWALAPTWVMDQCSRRLGEAFTLTMAPSGLKLVLFSDPQAVKQVFTAPPEVAPSGAQSITVTLPAEATLASATSWGEPLSPVRQGNGP